MTTKIPTANSTAKESVYPARTDTTLALINASQSTHYARTSTCKDSVPHAIQVTRYLLVHVPLLDSLILIAGPRVPMGNVYSALQVTTSTILNVQASIPCARHLTQLTANVYHAILATQ